MQIVVWALVASTQLMLKGVRMVLAVVDGGGSWWELVGEVGGSDHQHQEWLDDQQTEHMSHVL